MRSLWVLGLLLCAAASPAAAQIVVSGNDGKQRPVDPANSHDSVSVLHISEQGVQLLGTVRAPASLIGPPASVAVSRDSSFAIVTAAQRRGADGKIVPADTASLIDLTDPSNPAVLQTVSAGANASGVAISPDARLALIANGGGDSVSVFRIQGKTLSPAGTIAMPSGSKPLDVKFSPDGRSAYVVTQGDGRLVHLAIEGDRVTATGDSILLGSKPYSLSIDRSNRMAYVTNLGGRRESPADDKTGTVGIIDLVAKRMIAHVDGGITPEHLSLSPSGRYLELNSARASPAPEPAAGDKHGLLRIFRVDGGGLEPLADANTGQWCQGAVWSDDESRILLQCAEKMQIEVYRFDGKTLAPAPDETVQLGARPGAIASAASL